MSRRNPRLWMASGRAARWPIVVLVAAGCPSTTPANPSASDAGANTTGGGTTAASTTFVDPDDCQSSQDCETEGSCVAPYDPLPTGMPGQRGPAVCVEPCIDENDLSQWCIDNASCCGTLRCNPVDGFCEPPGPVSDDSDSGGTSTGTNTGTSTGTSDGSSTGMTGSSSTTAAPTGSSAGDTSDSSTGSGSGTGDRGTAG